MHNVFEKVLFVALTVGLFRSSCPASAGSLVVALSEHGISGTFPNWSIQLREFTALDPKTGQCKAQPEHPEFAWLEGIVNATAHLEYSYVPYPKNPLDVYKIVNSVDNFIA